MGRKQSAGVLRDQRSGAKRRGKEDRDPRIHGCGGGQNHFTHSNTHCQGPELALGPKLSKAPSSLRAALQAGGSGQEQEPVFTRKGSVTK